ncbi:ATP-binding cassette transporter snq2 [Rhizina undulata]
MASPNDQKHSPEEEKSFDVSSHATNISGTSSSCDRTIRGEYGIEGRESGRWGEQTEEPVDIEDAIHEFEGLRNELSRTATNAKNSISKPAPDEEEAGTTTHPFVDLEEYLQRTNREASDAGIIPKKVGVSFRNLTVSGTGSGKEYVRTFPEELADIFGKFVFDWARKRYAEKPEVKNIIQDFSGVVKPGEMLLVLARPGSGSSTFLRALTNQRREFTNISGEVHYAGLPFELAKGQYRGEILFNGEEDIHLPTLTVEQTLRFAMRTKTPSRRIPGVSRSAFVEQMLDLFPKMFGMKHVLKTMVGNQFIRGVSGGERKRVSIIEALAARATINAWDNSTRGLDSSTAVDYIRSLRIMTKLTHCTTIVTLYQAGEQIYREFDKVCVIDSGRQIFFGKASEAKGYFESLGYECEPRITTADFLTVITDPNERRIKLGCEEKVPLTPQALENAFRQSRFYTEVQEELDAYDLEIRETSGSNAKDFSRAVREDKSRQASKGSPYTVSFPMQVWYLMQREIQLQLQDKISLRSRFLNVTVIGLLIGSLFFQIPRTSEGAFAMGGALFFNIIVVGWMQMIEAINMANGRAITSKQTAFAFYRPSALVISKTFADLPVLVVQCTLFTTILYFMAGFSAEAGKFFTNLLFVLTTVICLTAFYRAVGSFSKDLNVSIRFAYFGLNVFGMFAGYMQTYSNMKSWVYKWIFWVHPLTYSQESVMVNQFHGMELECSPSHLIPGVPGASIVNQVCSLAGSEPMSAVVSGTRYIKEQFGYEPTHLWRNYGVICGFTVFYLIIAMIGVEVMSFGTKGASTKVFVRTSKSESESLPSQSAEKRSSDIKSSESSVCEKQTTEGLNCIPAAPPSVDENAGSVYTWKNVNYTVGAGASEKLLLHEVNGYVKPRRLTALMGPSGAGKTTLLDNLAHRKRVGVITGEFLMDGKPLRMDFERCTGFVEQQDVHDGTATVREALQFSALLRQPATVSKQEKFEFVEQIIKLLEMENLADALIGSPGVGLSVEERKRVTIGVELAAKPEALLFLDEPTSGLDSNGALSIVRFLRKLADESGLAILCTIHQPSAILFREFDDILLLAHGGKEVYFGPIGQHGSTILEYFERNGAPPATSDANPAEYILDTIRQAPGKKEWPIIWDESPEAKAVSGEIETLNSTRALIPSNVTERTLEYAMPLSTQIAAVTKRVWLHYWRNASYGFSKIFSNISMALITGVLFLKSGNTVLEMQGRGFAVFTVLILSPMLMTSIQPKFLEFRTLYETRERNSKIYSAPAFITAMAIAEIPYAILGTVFFFLPWYYMIGMPHSSARAGYEFFLILLYQVSIPHFAMWIAAMCKDVTIIGIVNPFIFTITIGFTGILVAYSSLPRFYSSWLYWTNPLTWLSRGLIGNALHGVVVECGEREFVTFQPPRNQTCGEYAGEWVSTALGKIVNLDDTSDCRYCQFKSGDEYLQTVNIDYNTRWRDLGMFVVFMFTHVALIYFLYWAFREFRWGRFFARLRKGQSSR